jgi:hypothetical protein
MVSRALPLLAVAVLTSAGAWHVSAPGASATAGTDPAGPALIAEAGQTSERSIAGRGQVSRGAVPVSAYAGGGAAPEDRGPEPVAGGGGGSRAPPAS